MDQLLLLPNKGQHILVETLLRTNNGVTFATNLTTLKKPVGRYMGSQQTRKGEIRGGNRQLI